MWGHNQHVISLADSRNTGSLGEPQPITIARCFTLLRAHWSVSFRILWGNNQEAHSLVDLQVHLNRWRGSANYRRSFSEQRLLLVSQFPNFVGRQPGSSLIGRFVGSLELLANLSQLQSINFKSTLLTGQIRIYTGKTSIQFHCLVSSHWTISLANLLYLP